MRYLIFWKIVQTVIDQRIVSAPLILNCTSVSRACSAIRHTRIVTSEKESIRINNNI